MPGNDGEVRRSWQAVEDEGFFSSSSILLSREFCIPVLSLWLLSPSLLVLPRRTRLKGRVVAVAFFPVGIFLFFLEEKSSGPLSAGVMSLTAPNLVPTWGEAFDVVSELPFKLAFTTGTST